MTLASFSVDAKGSANSGLLQADGKVTITEWMKFFLKQAAVGSDIADLMANIIARLDNDKAAPGEGVSCTLSCE